MTLSFFNSVGPPPERYADRVIAKVMQNLAEARATRWPKIEKALIESSDGTPKAQHKMAKRVEQAGALGTKLRPGKRGKYELDFFELVGWDPIRGDKITLEDDLPEKPWVMFCITQIKSVGLRRAPSLIRSIPLLFITHHVVSRAAQRVSMIDVECLMEVLYDIFGASVPFFEEGPESWLGPQSAGHRVQFKTLGSDAIVVLKQHQCEKEALVATTLLTCED